jgi:hypothetical protein
MAVPSHAFEIGYNPALEVIDHSELFLGSVPGSANFREWVLPKLGGRVDPAERRRVEELAETYQRIERITADEKGDATLNIGETLLRVLWEKPAKGYAVFKIFQDQQVAIVSLLLSANLEPHPKFSGMEESPPLLHFMFALNGASKLADEFDHRKFNLVGLTRRPLVAGVFWPPHSPTGRPWPGRFNCSWLTHSFGYSAIFPDRGSMQTSRPHRRAPTADDADTRG